MDRPAHRAGGDSHAEAWSRAELLRRAAIGGAGLGLVGVGGRLLLGAGDAWAAEAAAEQPVRTYYSHPGLRTPRISVVSKANGTSDGLLFLAPPSGPGQRGAIILDNAGEVVWFNPSTPDTTMDFRAGFYKGKPVLTWWEGRHIRGVGKVGSYVIVDDRYRELARFRSRDGIRPDFHEVMLTPDNTMLVLSYDPVPANLSAVGGPSRGQAYDGVVRELAIPSGRVLFEWRSLDHVAIEESYQKDIGDPYDYFHANSIGFDVDGNLLVSARNTWTIYKVSRRTGEVIWRLGGKKSDFAMGKGAAFAFQHDARSREHGRMLSLFDNGPQPNTKPRSRALVLRLDTNRMRATVARQIVHSPPLFAPITGNTQFLPNGNTFVCWGNSGYFSEYGPDGSVRFDAKLPKGGQNYRVWRFPWTGRPVDPPRVTAFRPRGKPRRLYASWNGATEVAFWQIRGGRVPTGLATGDVVPRTGFETELPIPQGSRYAAVAALDRNRKPLGISKAIRL